MSQEREDAAHVWDIWAAAKMVQKQTRDVPRLVERLAPLVPSGPRHDELE